MLEGDGNLVGLGGRYLFSQPKGREGGKEPLALRRGDALCPELSGLPTTHPEKNAPSCCEALVLRQRDGVSLSKAWVMTESHWEGC